MKEILEKLSEYKKYLGTGQEITLSVNHNGRCSLEYQYYGLSSKKDTLMYFDEIQEFLDMDVLSVLKIQGFVKVSELM